MAKGQIFVNTLEHVEKIDKAAYIVSLIVQNPEIINKVVFVDPFEKTSVFDEKGGKLVLEIEFKDDGTIKDAFRKHITEYYDNLLAELERVKQEKNKYD